MHRHHDVIAEGRIDDPVDRTGDAGHRMGPDAVQPAGVVAITAYIGFAGDVADRVIDIVAGGIDRPAGRRRIGDAIQRVVLISLDQIAVGVQPVEFLKSGVTYKT